ncbi:unnamed protein product [Phytophthora lilii]|uniref:Unnamed protein product n=1 Tax=Phytophthora lilii TaxID=2077276 RepID=A0A9W7CNZ8_9STRA|nr:unnamed protein product [Phytophthora lilii]
MKLSLTSYALLAAIVAAASLAADTTTDVGTVQPDAGTDSSATSQQQQQGTTASGDIIASMSVWGAPIVAETGTNHTSAEPTFGKVTSKTGGCVVGSPTEYISTEYLDWVWEHRIGPNVDTSDKANWNVMANKNWLMDHFVHNNGSINYCVRWDTDNKLDKGTASMFT